MFAKTVNPEKGEELPTAQEVSVEVVGEDNQENADPENSDPSLLLVLVGCICALPLGAVAVAAAVAFAAGAAAAAAAIIWVVLTPLAFLVHVIFNFDRTVNAPVCPGFPEDLVSIMPSSIIFANGILEVILLGICAFFVCMPFPTWVIWTFAKFGILLDIWLNEFETIRNSGFCNDDELKFLEGSIIAGICIFGTLPGLIALGIVCFPFLACIGAVAEE